MSSITSSRKLRDAASRHAARRSSASAAWRFAAEVGGGEVSDVVSAASRSLQARTRPCDDVRLAAARGADEDEWVEQRALLRQSGRRGASR